MGPINAEEFRNKQEDEKEEEDETDEDEKEEEEENDGWLDFTGGEWLVWLSSIKSCSFPESQFSA